MIVVNILENGIGTFYISTSGNKEKQSESTFKWIFQVEKKRKHLQSGFTCSIFIMILGRFIKIDEFVFRKWKSKDIEYLYTEYWIESENYLGRKANWQH